MKNKDKYQTYNALKEGFRNFCKVHSRSVMDCESGFGCCPLVVRCVLCYEMWKDSDTEIEEAESRAKMETEEAAWRTIHEFEEKYPGLCYNPDDILDPAKKLEDYLFFSTRLANVLYSMKIVTLGDFMGLSRDRLSTQKGVGKTLLKQFDTAVDSLARYKADLENGAKVKQ